MITRPADATKLSISVYAMGSRRRRPEHAGTFTEAMRARVRGCIGNMTGRSVATSARASRSTAKVLGSSTFEGRWSVTTTYFPSGKAWRFGASSSRAAGRAWTTESIITFPTNWIRSAGIPSARKFSEASRDGVKSMSESRSVIRRLISSGIDLSRLRRPASMCPTEMPSFAATSAAAAVELTSP